MPATTYLDRNAGKMIGNHLIPGSGDLLSSASAALKQDMLKDIQQKYFQSDAKYSGGDIPINDALKAIQYARSKKLTKSFRKGVLGGVKTASFVVGAAAGGVIGSVVPVAGTVAGVAVGGYGVATAVGGGATLLDQMKRKSKGLYKIIRGTRGEHRHQAARALLNCYNTLNYGDPKCDASEEALIVILGEEFDDVMAMTDAAAVERVADRLKSN